MNLNYILENDLLRVSLWNLGLYDDSILDQHQRQDRKRLERRLRSQARTLGFDLVPEAA